MPSLVSIELLTHHTKGETWISLLMKAAAPLYRHRQVPKTSAPSLFTLL